MAQWEHIEEASGNWETVFIPVPSPSRPFSSMAAYTLKNLQSGAVYDIVAKAKNKYGWSQLSKVFNFFNKGVGESLINMSRPCNKKTRELTNDLVAFLECHWPTGCPINI